MPVDISSHYAPPHLPFNPERTRYQAQWTLNRLGRGGDAVSLLFVDDEEISRLNGHYRGKEGPTNVLSFPLGEGDSETLSV